MLNLKSILRRHTCDNANDDGQDQMPKPQQQQQPSNITQNDRRGAIKNYSFVKTVHSLEELEKYRFQQNCCLFKGKLIRSASLPCMRKSKGKGCEFELRAVRPDLKSGTIHVYDAHSQHNHLVVPEDIRLRHRNEKELMSDANAPLIHVTEDNIEWHFIQTFADYETMDKFRRKNQCKTEGNEKQRRIRFHCSSRKFSSDNCQFMLLALKTTNNRYHVYKHGREHNDHVGMPKKMKQPTFGHQNQKQQQIEVEEQEYQLEEKDISMEDEIGNAVIEGGEGCSNECEDKQTSKCQEDNEKGEEEDDDSEDDDDDDEDDEDEEELPEYEEEEQQNGRSLGKITEKEYCYLMTVKSVEELNEIQLKNYCKFVADNPLNISKSSADFMRCERKTEDGKQCDFKLMALRTEGTMQIYAHSKHNHPLLESAEMQSLGRGHQKQPQMKDDQEDTTMGDEDENIGEQGRANEEDYCENNEEEDEHEEEQLQPQQEVQQKQQYHRRSLLGKITEKGIGQESCENSISLMPDANPPTVIRTPDNTEWTFLQTIPSHCQMGAVRCSKNQCLCKSADGWRVYGSCD